jgi:hypothetical protein
MPAFTQPPKHLVRAYLLRRANDTRPPPSPEEIRRQLGWGTSETGIQIGTESFMTSSGLPCAQSTLLS